MAKVFDLLGVIAIDSSQADQALQAFERRMDRTGRSLTRFGGNMSKYVTAPIVAAGAAAVASAVKMGNLADTLLDLEQITGLSTDTLQEFEQVALVAGVSTDVFQSAAEGLQRRLRAAGEESKQFEANIEALGISTRDEATGALRSMDDLLPEIIHKLQGMENVSERNSIAMQVLGRSGTDLAPVLGMTADEFERARQEAHEMGAVLDRETLVTANDARIEFEKLTKELGLAWREVSVSLIPVMKEGAGVLRETVVPAAKDVAESIATVIEWFRDLDPAAQRAILAVGGVATAAGPAAIALGKIVTVAPKVARAFRIIRSAILPLTGPAGLILGLATAVTTGLVVAWGEHDRAIDRARERTEEMRDAIGQARDRDALAGVIEDLSKDLKGSAKEALQEYAREVRNTTGDLEELKREAAATVAAIANAPEIARLEARRARLEAEAEAIRGNLRAFQSPEEMEAELRRLEAKGRAGLERGEAEPLTQAEINRLIVLRGGAQAAEEDMARLRAELQRVEEQIAAVDADLAALGAGDPVAVPRLQVKVEPHPENPAPDGDGGGNTDEYGLPTDGSERNVTVNVTANLPDPVSVIPEGDFELGPQRGPQLGVSVAPAREVPLPDASSRVAASKPIPVPDASSVVFTRDLLIDAVASVGAYERSLAGLQQDLSAAWGRFYSATTDEAREAAWQHAQDIQEQIDEIERQYEDVDLAIDPTVSVEGFQEAKMEIASVEDQIAQLSGTAPSQFDELREAVEEFGKAAGLSEDEIAALKGEIDKLEKSDKVAATFRDISSALREVGGATGGPLGDFLTGMADAIDLGMRFASGDIIGGIAGVLSQIVGGFQQARQAAQEYRQEIESLETRLSLLDTEALQERYTSREVVGTSWFGLVKHYADVFDESAAAFEIGIFEAVQNGMVSGLRQGMARYMETGNLEDLQAGIEVGLRQSVTNALFDMLMNEVIVAALQPHLTKLAEAIAAGDRPGAEEAARTIQNLVPDLSSELAGYLDGFDFLRPEGDPDPGPGGGPDDPARGPDVTFGRTPQAVQLATATPIMEAAQMQLQAATTMRDLFSGVDGAGFAEFGDHVDRFGEYVDQLVRRGIRLDVRAGGGLSTAFLRG